MATNIVENKKSIPRQEMPAHDPILRGKSFSEVALGYNKDIAILEASRCLQCKNPKCVPLCPVHIDIPGFIKLIKEGDFLKAAQKLKETNSLPAICGRVCPQEVQCEKGCILGKKGESVAIGNLERFTADFEREHGNIVMPGISGFSGKSVAIVGSGPAGLSCAGDLIKKGHKVTVFEAMHKPGGVLTYGIPEFRLPKAVVESEIEMLKKMGVRIIPNVIIGKTVTIDELFHQGFDAVFLGLGAGLPQFMNIPGENLSGVYSANEFLTRANLMKAYLFPEYDTPIIVGKRVAVIGGGNTAMDAARTALRLGPEKVYIVYRRSREEMPARIEEVRHGEEEGIEFYNLTLPVRFIGNEQGILTEMECVRMELGEEDVSGRRRPILIKGSEFILKIDTAIIAIGTTANPLVAGTTPGLVTNKYGYIIVDSLTGRTSMEGVFAAGDIVTGSATVIEAMGAGKSIAHAIDEYIMAR